MQQKNIHRDQFENDYTETVEKLKRLTRDSMIIEKAIKEKLNDDGIEELITLFRELLPQAIQNLSAIYYFLNKYDFKNVEKTKRNF